MTIELVRHLPIDNGKTRIIEKLEALLEEAKDGKLTGITYVVEMEGSFGWGKVNMTYPAVLGALQRAMHHVNKEWDLYSPEKHG